MHSLVIQAGGQSTRMGRDKALADFLGRPLITRVIERLAPLGAEVVITTNDPDAYRFLGLPLQQDLRPGSGALGGLLTALAAARHPLVMVAACDMPFASPDIFALAAELLEQGGEDVAVPRTPEGFEPLHAVYRRATCLPAVEQALAAGQTRLISWFPQVKVRILLPDVYAPLDPHGLAFMNANTPQELALAEAHVRRLGQG